jgi:cytochrome b6-f complex iron-sulfur subunit
MPLIDDLKFKPSPDELARRKFLGLVGSGAMATIALGAGITTVKFLEPSVLFEVSSKFKVGRPEDIGVGTLLVLKKAKTFIYHSAEGFFAMSSVCTHLGCMTQYDEVEAHIFCPCHGSQFAAATGKVTGGPAPKPLNRLKLTLDKGQLVVDTKTFVGMTDLLRV